MADLDDVLGQIAKAAQTGKVEVGHGNDESVDLGKVFEEMAMLSTRGSEVAELIRDRLRALHEEVGQQHVLPMVQPSIALANTLTSGKVVDLDPKGNPILMPPPQDSLTAIAEMARICADTHKLQADLAARATAMNELFISGLKSLLTDARRMSVAGTQKS